MAVCSTLKLDTSYQDIEKHKYTWQTCAFLTNSQLMDSYLVIKRRQSIKYVHKCARIAYTFFTIMIKLLVLLSFSIYVQILNRDVELVSITSRILLTSIDSSEASVTIFNYTNLVHLTDFEKNQCINLFMGNYYKIPVPQILKNHAEKGTATATTQKQVSWASLDAYKQL